MIQAALLRATLSHYKRHPWQSLLLFVGLLCGVGLWSAVRIINAQAEASYADADRLFGSLRIEAQISAANGGTIAADDYIALRRKGFRNLLPVIDRSVSLVGGRRIRVLATDLLALADSGSTDGVLGDVSDTDDSADRSWLRFIQPPYRLIVTEDLAGRLDAEPDERLKSADGLTLPPLTIGKGYGGYAVMDIAAARSVFPNSETVRFSYLAVTDSHNYERLRANLPASLTLTRDTTVPDLRELTKALHQHLDALGLLAFAVGLFIVFSTQRFALVYRKQTFDVLRTLGVDSRQLAGAIMYETLVWSVLGTVAGLALGYCLAKLLLPGVAASLDSLYGVDIYVGLLLQPGTVLAAWLLCLGGLLAALAWPLGRLLQGNAATNPQSSADSTAFLRRSDALAPAILSVTIVLAIVALWQVEQALQAFVLLGLILVSTAAMLPLLIRTVWIGIDRLVESRGARQNAVARPARQALLRRWALADGLTQLPALRAAMMALLLALSATAGIELMVGSFRQALESWLVERLSADIFLRAPSAPSSQPEKDASRKDSVVAAGFAEGWLADSHERYGTELHWQGRPTQLRGFRPDAPDSRSLRLAAGSLRPWLDYESVVKDHPEAAIPVLINEQASYLRGISVGDWITVSAGGDTIELSVAGVFYDYGNPGFALYLPLPALLANWSESKPQGTALWLAAQPDQQLADPVDLAMKRLQQAGYDETDYIRQDRLLKASFDVFDNTFAITGALSVLTLGIAGAALTSALLGLMDTRLPELALWRALGLSRRETVSLIARPVIGAAALTWLVSIPLGSLIAVALVDRINIISFGWSMPLHMDPAVFLKLGFLVFVVTVVSLAAAIFRMNRQTGADLARLGSDA